MIGTIGGEIRITALTLKRQIFMLFGAPSRISKWLAAGLVSDHNKNFGGNP